MNPYTYHQPDEPKPEQNDALVTWIAVLSMLYMVAQTARMGLIEAAKLI